MTRRVLKSKAWWQSWRFTARKLNLAGKFAYLRSDDNWDAFVQRWCLHVQPDQLTKTRYFGGWSNNRQGDYVARCRELLESLGRGDWAPVPQASEEAPREQPDLTCGHCGSDRMALFSKAAKPSWKELLGRESDSCPPWYADLQWESHRRFWTAALSLRFLRFI